MTKKNLIRKQGLFGGGVGGVDVFFKICNINRSVQFKLALKF